LLFPAELRDAVFTVLLCRQRSETLHLSITDRNQVLTNNVVALLGNSLEMPLRLISLPLHVVYYLLEFMVGSNFCFMILNRIGTGLKRSLEGIQSFLEYLEMMFEKEEDFVVQEAVAPDWSLSRFELLSVDLIRKVSCHWTGFPSLS
jgi:hypothetical protein